MSAAFQLNGGHPVLDLVNTLDNRFVAAGPLELLPSYAELLRFTRQSQILSAAQVARLDARAGGGAAGRVLHRVHELREALAVLLYAGHDAEALATVERQVLDADQHRALAFANEKRAAPISVGWVWGREEERLELPLWTLSKSAEALLTGTQIGQVRSCRRDSCRWLFLDSSKNHSRRWCDMQVCGNRVKAQRFHAKQQRELR